MYNKAATNDYFHYPLIINHFPKLKLTYSDVWICLINSSETKCSVLCHRRQIRSANIHTGSIIYASINESVTL